ncbi:ALKBH8 [Symbiodinium natans]|uniref:ALKBH8 protein n=1 Tax=Symbiodinium natans TaxID=878477 RepID=A0A812PRB2_9DINO|nr:ALKBH8 [Symbiodinium natans]
MAGLSVYSATLAACEGSCAWRKSLLLLSDLSSKRLVGNVMTNNSAISSCAKAQEWQLALMLFTDLLVKEQFDSFSCEIALAFCEAGCAALAACKFLTELGRFAFVALKTREARKAALEEQEKKAKEEEVSLVRSSSQDREVAQRLQSLGSEDPEHKDAQNHQQSMPKPPIAAQLLPKTFDTLITYENLSFWFRSSPPTMGHAPSVIAGPSILAALTAPGLRPSLVSNAATLQQRHHLAQARHRATPLTAAVLPVLCASGGAAVSRCSRGPRLRPRCTRACQVVSVEEAVKQVKGFHLFPEFLTEEEGHELAEFLDNGDPEWRQEQFGVPTLYRVKHFGVLGSLRPRVVRLPDPKLGEVDLPSDGILGQVSQRLSQPGLPWSRCLKGFVANEANVNDYSRDGSRLLLHWDDRGLYEECVCSVTVMGECMMTFQLGGRSNLSSSSSSSETQGVAPLRVAIPARSLLVLRGAARYEWQHGIPEPEDFLSKRRVAIIFRRVKGTPRSSATSGNLARSEACRRPNAPRRAMVISTNWPDPDVSAAGRVTSGRLRLLRSFCSLESGNAVSFASAARPGSAQGKLSAANDVQCFRIKTNDEASVVAALESAGNPELVLFDGFNAEERFGHYVRDKLPDSMRILDMQDFHALRLGRERLIEDAADASTVVSYRPTAFDDDLQRELASIHRCDATLAISEDERKLLVDTYGVPGWKVFAAPFGFARSGALPGYEDRQGAMFIGNWRHRPNRDCAKWLIQEVWPLVRQRFPDLELSVYGANQTPDDAALTQESLGAYVRGYCRSVQKAMRQHRLLVAPLRYGAGVKGKVLEAMQHGLVVVTTPVGVEGIASPESFPGYVVQTGGEDAGAFAEGIAEALRDPCRWQEQQQRATELLIEHFDE